MRADGLGAPVEPGRGEPADAAADHDQIVSLLDRQAVEGEAFGLRAQRVRDLERAVVLAAQAGQRRRIARRLRRELRRRRQARRDGQRRAVEKIAPRDRHGGSLARQRGKTAVHQPIVLGSQSASCGNRKQSTSATNCMATNGMMPR